MHHRRIQSLTITQQELFLGRHLPLRGIQCQAVLILLLRCLFAHCRTRRQLQQICAAFDTNANRNKSQLSASCVRLKRGSLLLPARLLAHSPLCPSGPRASALARYASPPIRRQQVQLARLANAPYSLRCSCDQAAKCCRRSRGPVRKPLREPARAAPSSHTEDRSGRPGDFIAARQ